MRITFIKENRDAGTESISTCDTAAFITRIKSETKPGHVSALRTMLEYTNHGSGGTYGHIDKLPRICPAMEYGRSREGERRMKRYNGIVLLEVSGLSGMSETELVKEQAALLPQTYAAFAGSSGRSVKIWALFALPNGKLPQREEEISLFHAHAYRMAVQCYQPLLPFPVTLKEPSCRYFPHDAGRSALLCPRCRTFLSRTTRDDARRADIQPTKIGGKQPFKAVAARIRLLANFHSAV